MKWAAVTAIMNAVIGLHHSRQGLRHIITPEVYLFPRTKNFARKVNLQFITVATISTNASPPLPSPPSAPAAG